MESEKDRFGDFIKLLERAQEDIYFAAKDQQLIAHLKQGLQKIDRPHGQARQLRCPKCDGILENYLLMKLPLDRCASCGGVWLDKKELEAIARLIAGSPLFSPTSWVP